MACVAAGSAGPKPLNPGFLRLDSLPDLQPGPRPQASEPGRRSLAPALGSHRRSRGNATLALPTPAPTRPVRKRDPTDVSAGTRLDRAEAFPRVRLDRAEAFPRERDPRLRPLPTTPQTRPVRKRDPTLDPCRRTPRKHDPCGSATPTLDPADAPRERDSTARKRSRGNATRPRKTFPRERDLRPLPTHPAQTPILAEARPDPDPADARGNATRPRGNVPAGT
ncbi:hypothetical protein BKA15_001924 [Microlunatus parietis]|uniref:Uncharacterized protein n=1 Tax=Microlunatus parietis TaxID=682979 RepID=A0A7Y9I5D6_9ACTN|nr:hypothetical protein [Microlunatus parietis]